MRSLSISIIGFQFTHPGRGATISEVVTTALTEVSIHAPREGCDLVVATRLILRVQFQFTHPGRGATRALLVSLGDFVFQFTHPGRGATWRVAQTISQLGVSIHAPREGCDHPFQ